MNPSFFEKPILNSPYELPQQHWELDETGQPTQKIIPARRQAKFISPIPKPRKRKSAATQKTLSFGDEVGISTEKQRYDPTPVINELRFFVDLWRNLPNPSDWQVTFFTRTLVTPCSPPTMSEVPREPVRASKTLS